MATPWKLAPETLEAPARGRNLQPGPLARQLMPGPVLLVFLRHFG